VIRKWFTIILGALVGSQVPAAGQRSAPQVVLAEKPVAPAITGFKAASTPLLASSLLLFQARENTFALTSLRYLGPDERNHRLEHLSPVVKLKTLILTQVSLPLVQFWDGKLQLDAFQSSLRIQHGQFGALGYPAMPDPRLSQQTFPGGSRSVRLSGVSLNFHFGRVEQTPSLRQAWKCVPRIVAALLN
jgi:hypothetical protein